MSFQVYSNVCINSSVIYISSHYYYLYSNVITFTRKKIFKCTYVHLCPSHCGMFNHSVLRITILRHSIFNSDQILTHTHIRHNIYLLGLGQLYNFFEPFTFKEYNYYFCNKKEISYHSSVESI